MSPEHRARSKLSRLQDVVHTPSTYICKYTTWFLLYSQISNILALEQRSKTSRAQRLCIGLVCRKPGFELLLYSSPSLPSPHAPGDPNRPKLEIAPEYYKACTAPTPKNKKPNNIDQTFANSVFPQPGGPARRTPAGVTNPRALNWSGLRTGA